VPLCGPALIGRALLHIAQGRLAEASDLLSEASIQYPLSAPTMLFQCWNDYLTGQYAKALDLIAQARAIGHCGSALDAVEALSLTGLEDPDESVERVKPSLPAHRLVLHIIICCKACLATPMPQLAGPMRPKRRFTTSCTRKFSKHEPWLFSRTHFTGPE